MSTNKTFVNREKRFEVTDKASFDTVVSRAGADDSMFYADLIDFSRNGMKLNLPFCAKFDEILKVVFSFKDVDLAYSGNLRVRHIRNVDENSWQVGCSCDPPLPEEVISHFAAQNNQERRRKNRQDVKGLGFVRRQGNVETCDAEILNISEGGFCLSVSEPHEVGERIDFTVFNSEGNGEVVEGRVRWQQEAAGLYHIGCSFVTSESYPNLMTCLTPLKDEKSESFPTQLLVAAMMAMILPSIAYFLMHFNNGSSVSQNDHATVNEVVSAVNPSQTPIKVEASVKEKTRKVADGQKKEKLADSKPATPQPAKLTKNKNPQPLKGLVHQPKRQLIDSPNAENASNASNASNAKTLTKKPVAMPGKAGPVVTKSDSKMGSTSRRKSTVPNVPSSEIESSPIPDDLLIGVIQKPGLRSGIPEELTKPFQVDNLQIGTPTAHSSRRIQFRKSVHVPSEEISTSN